MLKEVQLVGRRIAVTVSDPWDFGEECGVGPFFGRITDVDDGKILVALDHAIQYKDLNFLSVLCQVRHVNSSINALDEPIRLTVAMNIILLLSPVERLNEIGNHDYRGNLAAIGDARLA